MHIQGIVVVFGTVKAHASPVKCANCTLYLLQSVCQTEEDHGESEDGDGVATRLPPRDYGLIKTLQLRQCLQTGWQGASRHTLGNPGETKRHEF